MQNSQHFSLEEVTCGDLVNFGCYGNLYVTGIYTNCFWVTDLPEDRYEKNSCGWSISKSFATSIIEKGIKDESLPDLAE